MTIERGSIRANLAAQPPGTRKLTEDQVGVIKWRLLAGVDDHTLSDAYGVKPGTIGAIRRGLTWCFVQPTPPEDTAA